MQTRRVCGKMQNENIASLGSVDTEVSVRGRLAFWAKLPERLARLGNRVGPDDQAKVYAALHARIPMVTPDEQRAIQEASAEGDERFWEAMRDMGTASVEEHKALISRAETKIAEHAPKAAEAGERARAAKDRLERIRRGESVPRGLGKPFDVERALKAAGFTERDQRRCELLASLTEAEMRQASAKTCAEVVDAADRAIEREARRILGARREAERLRLTDDERAVLRIMERDLRRPLTEQEEHLALGQARALAPVVGSGPGLWGADSTRGLRKLRDLEPPASVAMPWNRPCEERSDAAIQEPLVALCPRDCFAALAMTPPAPSAQTASGLAVDADAQPRFLALPIPARHFLSDPTVANQRTRPDETQAPAALDKAHREEQQMATHSADIRWTLKEGDDVSKGRFSRGHELSFDGGVTVPASASPHVVGKWAVEAAVDPEEMLVAALSSCHMLSFLHVARLAGFAVASYADHAEGVTGDIAPGRLAVTKVVLHPQIEWTGAAPDKEKLAHLHHQAHEICFIANSVTTQVTVE